MVVDFYAEHRAALEIRAQVLVKGVFFFQAEDGKRDVAVTGVQTWALPILGTAATPASINYPLSILIVAIMVSYVGMVYGPIGAFLAEYFPARIRYSSVSVPYHIGNGWGGGLVPVITTAAYGTAQNAGLSM